MFSATQLILFAITFQFVLSSPLFLNLVRHEQRDVVPDGFVKSGSAPADQMLNLRLGLVQGDMATLEGRLYAVSTPGGPDYGQHLSKDAVEAFVKPAAESTSLVNEWLWTNGLNATTISPAGDWLAVTMPISKASSLFDAEFSVFTHQQTGKQSVRTLAYSIPVELVGHLDFVYPMITFENPNAHLPVVSSFGSSPRKRNAARNVTSRAVPSSCVDTITPLCLQEIYGIPSTPAELSTVAPECQVLGVSGFISQFANQADLTEFVENFRPDISSSPTFELQTLDGGENTQTRADAGTEANLDIQYTVGIATGITVDFISVGNDFQDGALDGFLDIINFLLAEENPPHVLTTSYGQNENTVSRNLAINLCNAYMQLGARGTSILFASGDGGVSGSQSTRCLTFVPTFPSGCPFLTSVGATTEFAPETAASFSSGGFSNFFAQPSYQSNAVKSYLTKLGTTNSGKFNVTGRAYPDVSAQGENVEIVVDGEFGTVAGTSCSSPIFASVIALLNDRIIFAGGSPLGFLNPFLYSSGASALNDITSGSNPGCNTNGFPAEVGWDPVTGLGTPNFANLLAAVGL